MSDVLNTSSMSNISTFLSLPSSKLKEYISALTKHMNKCEKEKKFLEADAAQKKIQKLTLALDKKRLMEVKEEHQEEKVEVEKQKRAELDKFNEDMDREFYKMNEKFNEMQKKLEQEHEQQMQELKKEYEEKFEGIPKKASPEILHLQRAMDVYIKKKDYLNAHKMQQEIDEKEKRSNEEYEKYKISILEKEIENLHKKQIAEKKGLEMKIQSHYNNFKKHRALRVQEILQNHKNLLRTLDNKQKAEEFVLDSIARQTKSGIKANIRAKGEYSNKVRQVNTAMTQKYLERKDGTNKRNNEEKENENENVAKVEDEEDVEDIEDDGLIEDNGDDE